MDWGGFFIFNAICDLFSSKDSNYEYDSSDVPSPYKSDQDNHSNQDIPEVKIVDSGLFFFLFWMSIICVIILIFALLLNID